MQQKLFIPQHHREECHERYGSRSAYRNGREQAGAAGLRARVEPIWLRVCDAQFSLGTILEWLTCLLL